MADPRPFPVTWQPYAGPLSRAQARRHLDQIWGVAVNPCSGVRLRQLPDTPPTVVRWSDFCELRLAARLRLIYRWVPADGEVVSGRRRVPGPLILVEAFGPHVGRDDPRDVFARLRTLHDGLPDDQGHAQLPQPQCCEDCDEDGRVALTKKEFLAYLQRIAAR